MTSQWVTTLLVGMPYCNITMGNGIARDIYWDLIMGNGVAMCAYCGITMDNNIATNLFWYLFYTSSYHIAVSPVNHLK